MLPLLCPMPDGVSCDCQPQNGQAFHPGVQDRVGRGSLALDGGVWELLLRCMHMSLTREDTNTNIGGSVVRGGSHLILCMHDVRM